MSSRVPSLIIQRTCQAKSKPASTSASWRDRRATVLTISQEHSIGKLTTLGRRGLEVEAISRTTLLTIMDNLFSCLLSSSRWREIRPRTWSRTSPASLTLMSLRSSGKIPHPSLVEALIMESQCLTAWSSSSKTIWTIRDEAALLLGSQRIMKKRKRANKLCKLIISLNVLARVKREEILRIGLNKRRKLKLLMIRRPCMVTCWMS